MLSAVSPFWAMTNTVARTLLMPRARKLSCPVISVGNIVAGGVGKTEIAVAIATHLLKNGKRVVVASRGYRSAWEKKGGVAFDATNATAMGFPDESIVILKKSPGVAVAVGADRVGVLEKHWDELRPDVVILDDGYQHFKLARTLDVLVHDFSVAWPVLRDLPIALRKARVRISLSEVPQSWNAVRDESPWIKARYELEGVEDSAGKTMPLPREALVFCGLGNPARFKQSLERAGVKVEGFKTFGDHAAYDIERVREIVKWARSFSKQGRTLPLLTTLKDYVKLVTLVESQGGVAGFEPLSVRIKLSFLENEEVLWKAIDESLVVGAH